MIEPAVVLLSSSVVACPVRRGGSGSLTCTSCNSIGQNTTGIIFNGVSKGETMYQTLPAYNNITTISAATVADWRAWLKRNGQKQKCVWLVLYKKESAVPSINYPTAVDEALCWGWIDSKVAKRDEKSWYQYFAQRSPKSNWSRVNKEKVARLQKEGRIQRAGQAVIDAAKKSGTWTALDEIEEGVIPDDLQTALNKNEKAAACFAAFPRNVKRGILEWINNAKKEETRAARIAKTAAMAAENKRALYG